MRARFFLVCGALSLVATTAALQACSGDTETTAAPKDLDSGADVAVDSAPEAAPVENDAATCDLSADFSTKIPDAGIADGATTTGVCMQCAKSQCSDEVKACNTDCTCQALVGDAIGCVLAHAGESQNQLLISCGGNFAGLDTNTQTLGLAIVNCLNKHCVTECATDSFKAQDAGNDADAN